MEARKIFELRLKTLCGLKPPYVSISVSYKVKEWEYMNEFGKKFPAQFPILNRMKRIFKLYMNAFFHRAHHRHQLTVTNNSYWEDWKLEVSKLFFFLFNK